MLQNPPNHTQSLYPLLSHDSTCDMLKLHFTTSWFSSQWTQTRVSPRHSSSSFILGGMTPPQLWSLRVSLSLTVALCPMTLPLYSVWALFCLSSLTFPLPLQEQSVFIDRRPTLFLCTSSPPELLSDLKFLKTQTKHEKKIVDAMKGCHLEPDLTVKSESQLSVVRMQRLWEMGCVDIPGSTAHMMGGSR